MKGMFERGLPRRTGVSERTSCHFFSLVSSGFSRSCQISTWYWKPRNQNLLTAVAASPFLPNFWKPYAEDAPWTGAPTENGSIVLTRTQASFFGQPGQAPTQRYKFTFEPDTNWIGTPTSNGAINATRSQTSYYGMPGAAYASPWTVNYDP